MDHYLGWWIFLQRLLKDDAVLTHDPYEANLFYVPALTYYYSGNTGEAGEHIRVVTQWVAGLAGADSAAVQGHGPLSITACRDHICLHVWRDA
jgi:hypothetical protein